MTDQVRTRTEHDAALATAIAAGIVAYREALEPLRVVFTYMADCHVFAPLSGSTLDEIVEHAITFNADAEWGSYGSLCPVSVLRGKRELRRVGSMVHFRQRGDRGDPLAIAAWIAACDKDPDIMRWLETTRAEAERTQSDTHPPANLEQSNLHPETPQASSGKEGG